MKATLGSFSKLPAASCQEIKNSSGGMAPSGRYWIDRRESGNKPVIAYCDMERGGKFTGFTHLEQSIRVISFIIITFCLSRSDRGVYRESMSKWRNV